MLCLHLITKTTVTVLQILFKRKEEYSSLATQPKYALYQGRLPVLKERLILKTNFRQQRLTKKCHYYSWWQQWGNLKETLCF